jgi:hypothetical protein
LWDACDDDDDGDGIPDFADNCALVANAGQANADGDVLGDACDACATVYDPPVVDADTDGIGDGCDCAAADASVWLTPGAVAGLTVTGGAAASLAWPAPSAPGATAVVYDTLRSASAADWSGAACVASDAAAGLTIDADLPGVNGVFFYLIRAVNGCPGAAADGPLGATSAGALRVGPACP